ncbi:MAG: hypothetical protein E6J20_16585 [Chloroflexi bacterium]|nr:MAG: hypothetical protein E6J20_16585 [Chloroflexota bacterium]
MLELLERVDQYQRSIPVQARHKFPQICRATVVQSPDQVAFTDADAVSVSARNISTLQPRLMCECPHQCCLAGTWRTADIEELSSRLINAEPASKSIELALTRYQEPLLQSGHSFANCRHPTPADTPGQMNGWGYVIKVAKARSVAVQM